MDINQNRCFVTLWANVKILAEVARTFSKGSEAKSGGIIGPVELGTLSPNLAGLLRSSQSGQLWSPQPSAEGYVIVRLKKLIPARLDESMRQRLLNELFEAWLQEQMKGMGEIRKKLFYPNLHNCI
ncbi:MAG: peptidylprolyl isomerase [Nostoc sp. C3-bin3]|nr:peptidylprolyl isomerase [Nostoc sp. C3-bin3]